MSSESIYIDAVRVPEKSVVLPDDIKMEKSMWVNFRTRPKEFAEHLVKYLERPDIECIELRLKRGV